MRKKRIADHIQVRTQGAVISNLWKEYWYDPNPGMTFLEYMRSKGYQFQKVIKRIERKAVHKKNIYKLPRVSYDGRIEAEYIQVRAQGSVIVSLWKEYWRDPSPGMPFLEYMKSKGYLAVPVEVQDLSQAFLGTVMEQEAKT